MVAEDLYFGGEKFIPVRRAAEKTKYSIDYVGQLCRSGKIVGKRVGRMWYVSDRSLDDHLASNSFSKGSAYRRGDARLISLKEAALETSYSTDYIGQLCRSGKIDGKQVGRVWYVEEKSLLEHLKQNVGAKGGTKRKSIAEKDIREEATPTGDAVDPELIRSHVGKFVEEKLELVRELEREREANLAIPLFPPLKKKSETPAAAPTPTLAASSAPLRRPRSSRFALASAAPALALFFLCAGIVAGMTRLAPVLPFTLTEASNRNAAALADIPAFKTYSESEGGKLLSSLASSTRSFIRSAGDRLADALFGDIDYAVVVTVPESDSVARLIEELTKLRREVATVRSSPPATGGAPAPQVKVIERITASDITKADLSILENKLKSEIYRVAELFSRKDVAIDHNVSQTNRINDLYNVGLHGATIDGASSFSGTTLTASGAVSVGATLAVSGAGTFNSTLAVTGAATFSSTMAVAGLASFSGGIISTASSTITDLTIVNSTTTNATSTDFFASNLYTPNLVATTSATLGTTTATNLTVTNLATSTFAGGLSVGGAWLVVDQSTGYVGIGTSTPAATLAVNGGLMLTGTTTITGAGSGLTFTGTGNHDIVASGGTLRIGSNTIIGNIQALDDTVDIGTPATRFDKIYANEVNATTLVGTIAGGNVSAETLSINSDNATADAENAFLSFERGTISPNALLWWNSAGNAKRFEFNQPLYIENASASTTLTTLDLKSVAGQTADIFRVSSSSGTNLFNITSAGDVSIPAAAATTTIAGGLTVGTTNLVVDRNTSRVGIGKISPQTTLQVNTLTNDDGITISNDSFNGVAGGLFQNNGRGYLALKSAGVVTASLSSYSDSYLNGGNVGIGSTTPWGLLSVNPNGITGPALVVGSSTATNFIVTNGGNVGIGTTSPGNLLSVQSAAGLGTNLEIVNTSAGSLGSGIILRKPSANSFNTIGFYIDTVRQYFISNLSDNSLRITRDSAGLGGSSNDFVLATGGNIGIGSTTPWGLLSVNPNGVTGPAFVVGSSTATNFIVTNGGNVGIMTSAPVSALNIANGGGIELSNPSGVSAAVQELVFDRYGSAAGGARVSLRSQESGNDFTTFSIYDRWTVTKPMLTVGQNTGTSYLAQTLLSTPYDTGYAARVNGDLYSANYYLGFQGSGATPSPSGVLAIAGVRGTPSNLGAGSLILQSGQGTGNAAPGDILFQTADVQASGGTLQPTSTKMTIKASGNVGIGTTSPIATLAISGANDTAPFVVRHNAVGNNQLNLFDIQTNGTSVLSLDNRGSLTYDATNAMGQQGQLTLNVRTSSDDARTAFTVNATNSNNSGGTLQSLFRVQNFGSTKFHINTAGNVGIGTTSPLAKLSLETSANDDGLYMSSSGTGGPWVTLNDTNGPAYTGITVQSGGVSQWNFGLREGSGKLHFYDAVNATDRMVITNTGNVGIGTTTPGAKLNVLGTTEQLRLSYDSDSYFAGTVSSNSLTTLTFGGSGGGLVIDGESDNGIINVLALQGAVGATKLLSTPNFYITSGGIPTVGASGYFSAPDSSEIGDPDQLITGGGTGLAITTDGSFWLDTGGGVTGDVVVNTSGNVGIGTTTPFTKLAISGSQSGLANASAAGSIFSAVSPNSGVHIRNRDGNAGISGESFSTQLFTDSGAGNFEIYNASSAYGLVFGTNATERMRITSGGNVGIGTTTPTDALNVYASTNAEYGITIKNANSGSSAAGRMVVSGDTGSGAVSTFSSTYGASQLRGNAAFSATNALYLISNSNAASGGTSPIVFQTGGYDSSNERMRITSAGNIGIGTASPLFDGNNTIHVAIEGATNSFAELGLGSNQQSVTGALGSLAFYNSNIGATEKRNASIVGANDGALNSGYLGFNTASAGTISERLRITSTGNVGIGTTSPASKLHVEGNGIRITNSASYAGTLTMALSALNTASFSNTAIGTFLTAGPGNVVDFGGQVIRSNTRGAEFSNSVGGSALLTTTGNVGIGTTSPGRLFSVQGDALVAGTLYASGITATGTMAFGTTTLTNLAVTNTSTSTFAGGLTVAASGLVYQQATGNVGIGITNPSFNLDVNGKIRASAQGSSIGYQNYGGSEALLLGGFTRYSGYAGSGQPVYFYHGEGGDFVFDGTSGERLRIKGSTGNVGIGTTTPAGKLSVYSGSSASGANSAWDDLIVENGSHAGISVLAPATQAGAIAFTTPTNNQSVLIGRESSGGGSIISGSSGSEGVFSAVNGILLGTNSVIRMKIDTSGNVGIGSTSPIGRFVIQNSATDQFVVRPDSNSLGWSEAYLNGQGRALSVFANPQGTTQTGFGGISYPAASAGIMADTDTHLVLGAGNAERMRIDLGGNVGIGTTTPGAKLTVDGTLAGIFALQNGSTNFVTTAGSAIGGSDTRFRIWNNANTAALDLYGSGSINSSGAITFFTLDTQKAVLTSGGLFGIATSSPWGLLSVNPNDISGPAFVVGSSTATNFIVTNAGNVGIGTTSPGQTLAVGGTAYVSGAMTVGGGFTTTNGTFTSATGVSINLASNTNFTVNGNTAAQLNLIGASGNFGIGTTSNLSRLAVAGGVSIGTNYNFAAPTNGLIVEGNVGIGTTSPFYKLAVSGGQIASVGTNADGSATGQGFVLNNIAWGSNSGLFKLVSGNAVQSVQVVHNTAVAGDFSTSDTLVTFKSDGNVGIGTTTPGGKLHITTSGTADNIVLDTTGSGIAGFSFKTLSSVKGYFAVATAPNHFFNGAVAGDLNYRVESGGRMLFGVDNGSGTANPTLTINASSNVGIGTTSPAAKLDVNGTVVVNGAQPSSVRQLSISNGIASVAAMSYQIAGVEKWVTYSDSASLGFGIQQAGIGDRLTISSAGLVGIGSTTPDSNLVVQGSAGASLHVWGPSNNAFIKVNRGISSQNARVDYMTNFSTDWQTGVNPSLGGGSDFSIDTTALSPTEFFISKVTGNVGIGTSTPQTTLNVRGVSVANYGQISIDSTNAAAAITMYNTTGAGLRGYWDMDAVANTMRLQNHSNGSYGALTLNADGGNVGIGTTSPFGKFSVDNIPDGSSVYFKSTGRPFVDIRGGVNSFKTLRLSDDSSANGYRWDINSRPGNDATNPHGLSIFQGTTGTEVFSITTGGNVGIGTSTPGTKLDIRGQTPFRIANTDFIGNTGTYADIQFGASSGNTYTRLQAFNSGGGAGGVLSINPLGGNVGIGTTTPLVRLGVNYSGSNIATLIKGAGAGAVGIGSSGIGFLQGYTNDSASALGNLAIQPDGGNVGIGTTTPENKLTILASGNGNSVTAASTNSAIRIHDTNSNVGAKQGISWERSDINVTLAALEPEVAAGWPTDLKFLTNTDGAVSGISEKMRITAAGRVGIGTTTPGAKLNVIGALCVDDTTPTCGNAARTDGTIYAVNAFSATLDLAEAYPTKDATLTAGELVMLDPVNPVFVARADKGEAMPTLGIVSTKPGFYLGGFNDEVYANDTKLPVALSGRVPTFVSLENGPIRRGDRIALSSVPGVGMKATTSGMTVGVALEDFDGTADSSTYDASLGTVSVNGLSYAKGSVLVFVNLSYQKLDSDVLAVKQASTSPWFVDETGGIASVIFDANVSLKGHALLDVQRIASANGLWSIDEQGKLIAQEIETKKLKVDAGVTTKDRSTGEFHCLFIANGSVSAEPGECGTSVATAGAPAPAATSTDPGTGVAATEPAPTDPVATSTPATTEPVLVQEEPVIEAVQASAPAEPAPAPVEGATVTP